jgi:hypothetical protein
VAELTGAAAPFARRPTARAGAAPRRNRLVATYYGFYNTVSALGNLVCGALWDYAHTRGANSLVWLTLTATGAACAAAVAVLARAGLLTRSAPRPDRPTARPSDAGTHGGGGRTHLPSPPRRRPSP